MTVEVKNGHEIIRIVTELLIFSVRKFVFSETEKCSEKRDEQSTMKVGDHQL